MKLDVTALVFGLLILLTGAASLWAALGHIPPVALRVGLPAALVAIGVVGISFSRQSSTTKRKDAHHE